jgi:hypothetical protein
MVRYHRADRQLRMLDTPDAIRAKVAHLRMSVDEWRTAEANVSGEHVAYSSRPDLVAAALRDRAASPEFGVTPRYFELWAKVLLERDHPALVRLTRSDRAPEPETGGKLGQAASRELLDTVRALNRAKTGVAADITGATLRQVERDLAKP